MQTTKKQKLKRTFGIAAGSVLSGLSASLVVCCYLALAAGAVSFSKKILDWGTSGVWQAAALLIFLFTLSLLGFWILCRMPFVRGGGVPQAEGLMRGHLQLEKSAGKTILAEVFSTGISFLSGLPFGIEGPSIFLGSLAASGTNNLLKREKKEKLYNISGGAAAGFAVAFNAPLTGLLFSLEEGQKRFSPFLFLTSAVSIVCAVLFRDLFFPNAAVFPFLDMQDIPWTYFAWILPLGILCGLFAVLFSKGLLFLRAKSKSVSKRWRYPLYAAPFLTVFVTGFFLKQGLWSGSQLLQDLTAQQFSVWLVLLILSVRFLLIAVSFSGGASGGLLVPTLVQGALLGFLTAKAGMAFGMEENMLATFILLGMTGFFAAMVKAPVTAIVLTFELSGSLINLLPCVAVVLLAYFTSHLLKGKPFYDEIVADLAEEQAFKGSMVKKSSAEPSGKVPQE